MSALLFLSTVFAAPAASGFDGPDHGEVDLLRVVPHGPRIYVRATYPDGSRGLFLVDTGANLSLLSRRAAQRLGLEVQTNVGSVVGLGGVSRMDRAMVPSLQLGETVVPDVEVAVGVPGLSERAGAMELDGLLGNNVWSRFTLELDYPADRMVLHRPGTVEAGRKATALVFDGSHLFTPLEIRTTADPSVVHSVVLRIDTGAGELSLCGPVAEGLGAHWTEGLEMVRGLGASETLPPFQSLRRTRRLALEEVRLGGRRLRDVETARWMSFDGEAGCPDGMRGLIGQDLLEGHRVLLDYQGGHLELSRSRRARRALDGHRVVLDEERERFAPERAMYRARLALHLEDLDAAMEELQLASEVDSTRIEALVLLARLERFEGHPDEALARLLTLSPGQLVDENEIVATVNQLIFAERGGEALELARRATAARPEVGWSHVALSDALLAAGEMDAAESAIAVAVEQEAYPDAHRMRRARIALARGDREAGIAHVRRLLKLYPMGGEFLWLYALLAEEGEDRALFRDDLERALARIHPERRPHDFLIVARRALGDDPTPDLDAGLERDCRPLEGADRDNCLAWYWSLSGIRVDEALHRAERALAHDRRSAYLDTLAIVHQARGDLSAAAAVALEAAQRAPDSVYMLWQVERLRALAEAD